MGQQRPGRKGPDWHRADGTATDATGAAGDEGIGVESNTTEWISMAGTETYSCPECTTLMSLVSRERRLIYVCPQCKVELACNDIRVDEVFAFLSIDPKDGNEGITGYRTPDGWLPLLCADKARVDSMRGLAQEMSTATNARMKLVRFSLREDLEEIVP